jgi:hypothetical protein
MVLPFQLREWKKKREAVQSASATKEATMNQQYLVKMTTHEGCKPSTEMVELVRVKQVYEELRERDRVVTSSFLAPDL